MSSLSAAEDFGARVTLPPQVRPDPRMPGALFDPDTDVRWWVHVGEPRLCLDDHALADLREHAKHHARAMFMTSPEARERHGARTDDPTWCPLIELERREDVLHLVHRMTYEPGREMVMGHRMLPTARGLVEVRVLAMDGVTGARESVLTLAAMTSDGAQRPLTQAEMDAPEHDAKFPQHALSRVRAALETVSLTTLSPAPPLPRAEVELTSVGVALVPPPRFSYLGHFDDGEWFGRTSFCVTDGVEHFGVARRRGRVSRDALARRGRDLVRELLLHSRATDVEAEVMSDDDDGAFVFARAKGNAGPLGHAYAFFRDENGDWGYVAILGALAVPPERRVQDLRASLRTRRVLETKKPFWKIW